MSTAEVRPPAARRRRSVRRSVAASIALLLGIVGGVVGLPSAAFADGPTTFTNTASIAIPATGSADQIGPASPYPSPITVSGMAGAVTAVQVVFHNLTHGALNDVDAMVVAPSGANLVVLSDIGDPAGTLAFANNATLTFDDAAAGGVPTGNVPTGTYRPTNSTGVEAFPAPAPAPSAQTTLAGAFTGINPNGVWQLFVVDDATGDVGQMAGGWSLVVTTEVAAVPTTTVVTTSGTPSSPATPVTFTATVTASGAPVTTGTVAFALDGVPTASGVALNGAGVATWTAPIPAEGTHVVTATYSGATGFLTSNGSVTQRVDNPTTVSGSTFCNTGPLTLPASGAASPYPSNITVAPGLLGGPVTKVTVTLNGLSHAVPVDLDVMLSGPVPTTNVVLMSDVGGTSPVSGLTVVFDDAAAGTVPTPLTAGTFRPSDDDSDAADAGFPAPAPIVSGATTLATFAGSSGEGQWSLWVLDDATGDAGSISGGWCLTIESLQPTVTTLTSSVNPSTFGQAVTFTATVTAGGSPVTAGSVAFADGATPLGVVPLAADGTATFTTSGLSPGTHSLSADYAGTAAFGSSSAALTQVVNVIPTATTLTSNLNPSTFGQPVTFTATVTAGGSPVTGGSITFTDGATTLFTASIVSAGTVSFTTSALTAGSHAISATYSGTAVYGTSSASLDQVVNTPVVAEAGGPYTVAEGADLTLDGTGSTPGATYEWDVDGDGDFTDATGLTPTLTWAELEALGIDDGPASHTTTLRVTLEAQVATDTADLDVINTAPVTVVSGERTATAGEPFTVKVGADDPSAADMAALFLYTVDWGDGSPVLTVSGPADPPVTHTYAAAGTYAAVLTATDKDGGTGEPVTIQVVVAAAPTPPPPPVPPAPPRGDALPATGADPAMPLLAAALLLTAGTALVAGARRRRVGG